ncbi:MAG: hypothetical protein ACYS4W_05585 [Planctomycetota bacterium]
MNEMETLACYIENQKMGGWARYGHVKRDVRTCVRANCGFYGKIEKGTCQ